MADPAIRQIPVRGGWDATTVNPRRRIPTVIPGVCVPPTLIAWGKNDGIFTVAGAELYKRELPNAELHLLDTGHFALEEEVDRIGSLMHEFLDRTINTKTRKAASA